MKKQLRNDEKTVTSGGTSNFFCRRYSFLFRLPANCLIWNNIQHFNIFIYLRVVPTILKKSYLCYSIANNVQFFTKLGIKEVQIQNFQYFIAFYGTSFFRIFYIFFCSVLCFGSFFGAIY